MDDKRQVLEQFVQDIRRLLGDRVSKVILYGSYARGDYGAHSDIDLMILTRMTDKEIIKIEDQVFDLAYEYELKESIPISVNIKNIEHYEYWLGALPYYNNIRREGVVLVG